MSAIRAESLAKMRNATNKSGTEELWVGEAGGAAGGGHPGLTDSYSSGLWWLPALGEKAKSGHSIYCRQDLVGGDYGLLHDVRFFFTPLVQYSLIQSCKKLCLSFWQES